MNRKIKIYKKNKILKQSFSTASGTLNEKEIIQILFFENEEPVFIYELPLSPSLGEMPIDVFTRLTKEQFGAFTTSTHLRRAFSYYESLPKINFDSRMLPLIELNLVTYGIHDWPNTNNNAVNRLKCNSRNINSLIQYSKNAMNKWVVDFNGSLNEEEFLYFLKYAALKNCIWVEQPLKPGVLNILFLNETPIPIFADEDMLYLSQKNFHESGYKGCFLKPIRHNCLELMTWLKFVHEKEIPCIIGNPICDIVSISLSQLFNQVSTVKVNYSGLTSDFIGEQFSENVYFFKEGRVNINKNIFPFIERNYDLVFYLNVPN